MPRPKSRKSSKRLRRKADEARRQILDTAEARLSEVGPDALRLKDVATDVGISHPAVLHHFGSRAELVSAVVQRTILRLHSEMLSALQRAEDAETDAASLLQLALGGLTQGGHARLVAWLALSGHDVARAVPPLEELARVLHERRLSSLEPNDAVPALDDSKFLVRLVTLTLFGEAIVGDQLATGTTEGDADRSERFRRWLAKLLVEHVRRC